MGYKQQADGTNMADNNKCTACNEDLQTDFVLCSSSNGCKLHFQCAGIKEITWRKTDKNVWKCHDCRRKPTENAGVVVSASEMRQFMTMVTNKLGALDALMELKPAVQKLEESVQFLSSKFDEIKACQENNATEIKTLKNKVSALTGQDKKKDKIIRELKINQLDMEQQSRNRNLEISGIEHVEGEDLKKIMGKLAAHINVTYKEDDIDIIHRVPSKIAKGPPKIIAQFGLRNKRDEWVENRRKLSLVSRDVVDGSHSTVKIFIGEHMSAAWKDILWKAKLAGKDKGYKAIWFKKNKILAKKAFTDQNAIHIYCEDDIDLLV